MKYVVVLLMIVSAMSLNAQEKIKVACIGDSITEGAGIEDGERYPEQLQRLLGDGYEVRNYGIGGRTLLERGDFSYWQEEKYKEVLAWIPDIVIIELGTNDSKPQNWIYEDSFTEDYRAFIQSFKNLPGKRRIFICTPMPVFKDGGGITAGIVADEIMPAVKQVSKKEKVKLVDLYTAFIGRAELAPDGIHPNAEGAKLIAENVFAVIK
ncbi:MAG TPA: GDSL-type esterase/lipase family protein [Chryseosolibacter sp.]|nr:GDSL-type esterase/lipase family protein [Chryseosolibacter sp.]